MTRRLLLTFALIIPVIWSLPLLCGYISSFGENLDFLGWMRSDDYHRYGSFIEQTYEYNRIVYKDYSALKPQSPRMIAIYFTVLGFFKKLLPMGAQHWWALSRIIVCAGFIIYLWSFTHYMDLSPSRRWYAFLFVLLGSGFEFALQWTNAPGLRLKNFWMDGFSTFSSFHNPLKIAGLFLGLIILKRHFDLLKFPSFGNYLTMSFLILLLWGIHPNSAIPVYFALGFAVFFPPSSSRDKWSLRYGRHMLKSAPYLIPFTLIYIYIEWMKTDPVTAGIIDQYHVPFSVEPIRYYIVRYGVILPLGLLGVIRAVLKGDLVSRMLAGWWIGAEIFSHHPMMTGLLFQHTVHLPLALLAAGPFADILDRIRFQWLRSGVIILVFSTFFVNNIFIVTKVCRQTRDDVWPTTLYATNDELAAIKKLRTLPKGNVLVNRDTGNKISWLALQHVFLGHWGTTPEKQVKEKQLKEFYSGKTPLRRKQALLEDYRIRYIWYGPRERKLGELPPYLNIRQTHSFNSITLIELQENAPSIQLQDHETQAASVRRFSRLPPNMLGWSEE